MARVPPGSMGAPLVGEALKFLKDPFTFTIERTKRHGNIWKTKIMGDPVVFFAGPKAFSFFINPENFTRENGSPKFLQAVLDPDAVPFLDGDKHRTRKRLLLSAFTREALAGYLPIVMSILERFVASWTDGAEREVVPDLDQCAFDIANALFGAADPATSDPVRAADFQTMNKGAFAPPIKLPFTAYGKGLKARDRLRAYMREQIGKPATPESALAILKGARGAAGEQLTPLELEIELIHFFVAAHAGLCAALAWMLVVLGEHPEIAARLRAEAEAVFDDRPAASQIGKLTLARCVGREVLRAYPIAPVTFIGVAKKDLEIDGYAIPAGWKGAGAIWATLQDGSVFPDPTAFRDDRLGDDAVRSLPANAYCPQGGGPADGHRCPGDVLIQMVMPAFLAWFTRHYDLAYSAQDVTPVGGGIGPLPRSGLRLSVQRRS